jgi:hypothetical protein
MEELVKDKTLLSVHQPEQIVVWLEKHENQL